MIDHSTLIVCGNQFSRPFVSFVLNDAQKNADTRRRDVVEDERVLGPLKGEGDWILDYGSLVFMTSSGNLNSYWRGASASFKGGPPKLVSKKCD